MSVNDGTEMVPPSFLTGGNYRHQSYKTLAIKSLIGPVNLMNIKL